MPCDPGDRRAYRIHLCAAAGPQLDTLFRTSAAVQDDALHRMHNNLGAP